MNILIFPNGFSMREGMSENNNDDSENVRHFVYISWAKNILKWGRRRLHSRRKSWSFNEVLLQGIFSFSLSFHSQMEFFCAQNLTRKLCDMLEENIFVITWIKLHSFGKLCVMTMHFKKCIMHTSKLSSNFRWSWLCWGKLCCFVKFDTLIEICEIFNFPLPMLTSKLLLLRLNFVILCHRRKLLLFSHVTSNNDGKFTDWSVSRVSQLLFWCVRDFPRVVNFFYERLHRHILRLSHTRLHSKTFPISFSRGSEEFF